MSKLKIFLAVLSLICVFDLPYGFYQLYRVVAMVCFSYLFYVEIENKGWNLIWLSSAILVQPIFKIAIGRDLWNIIDIIFAILLIVSTLAINKKISND